MYKAMKIKNLKNYGIPSYVLDIWEERYFSYLLPLQEEAVRNYGSWSCDEIHIALKTRITRRKTDTVSRIALGYFQFGIFCEVFHKVCDVIFFGIIIL